MVHEQLHRTLLAEGQKQTFETYYSKIDESYGNATDNRYHAHRLEMLGHLLRQNASFRDGVIVDFGCGDGVFGEIFAQMGASVIGIDPSDKLLSKYGERLKAFPGTKLLQGSVEALASIEDNSVDAITAFDVLDYLSEAQEDVFYTECHRILKKGGAVFSSHSNELFDLYTFNRYTVSFFEKHFDTDISGLIQNPDKPVRSMANIRGNPLAHNSKVGRYGFAVKDKVFLMHHPRPPLLMPGFDPDAGDKREFLDTRTVPECDQWTLHFTCSVFGVCCVKV